MPSAMVFTVSKVNKLPLDVRRSVIFYAPLLHHLDFIGIEPCTFSRATGGLVKWRDTYLRTLGNNVPRFEYDEAGNALGLLLEGSRPNNLLYSEDFSNAAWQKTNITVTPNDTGTWSPLGSYTADLLTADAGNATIAQYAGVVGPAWWDEPFTVYLRRKTGTGTISLSVDGGATWTPVTINSTGWTRVQKIQQLDDVSCGIKITDSGDEIWAWGAQLEPGYASPSSYIPTTGSIGARSFDSLQYPITNPIASAVKTLIWVEEGVSKVNHLDGAPFSSTTGIFNVTNPVHVKEIVGFNQVLTAQEIAIVRSELTSGVVPIVQPQVPTPISVPFSQSVAAGELSVDIHHNIGNSGHRIFAAANWLTDVAWSAKQDNQTTLIFNVQCPIGGGTVEGVVEL